MKPDYEKITKLPWDAEEVGVEEWFLVSREQNAAGEDDGWNRIGEIDKREDVMYAVHAANAYPRLVEALKKLKERAEEIGESRSADIDCEIAAAALREAGEI